MQWSSHRLFGCADYFYFFKDEGQHRTWVKYDKYLRPLEELPALLSSTSSLPSTVNRTLDDAMTLSLPSATTTRTGQRLVGRWGLWCWQKPVGRRKQAHSRPCQLPAHASSRSLHNSGFRPCTLPPTLATWTTFNDVKSLFRSTLAWNWMKNFLKIYTCIHLASQEWIGCGIIQGGSLSSGAKMAMKIFVKRVFTIFASSESFLRVIANLQN